MPRSPITAIANITRRNGVATINLTADAAEILGYDRAYVPYSLMLDIEDAAAAIQAELDASFAAAQ